nr:ABC transporter permease [Anaerolineae bacterium]
MKRDNLRIIWPAVPVLLALVVITILLFVVGADPITTYSAFWTGSFATAERTFSTLAFWVPLLLCATGLLVTFTAGLWNIGVEGQMIMGAVGASWVALKVANALPNIPGLVIIPLELIIAFLAGALWAGLAAILKTRGGVHEIFGGVALNSLAIIATNYLISGPWQPPEGGTFRGTQPFPAHTLLPLHGDTLFSPLSLVLALLVLLVVMLTLKGTFWGLKLKALGKNLSSAFMMGISSEREAIIAMMLCGGLAGLAGAVRVLSWFDSLRQSISGGIGFLAILIVLLSGMRPLFTLVIALLFSALLTGGSIVQLRTQLHSSISGIIQGLLVLFMLLFGDYRKVIRKRRVVKPAPGGDA